MTVADRIIQATPESFWLGTAVAAGLALTCFFLAFHYLRRARLIADIPTSKIRSAAQGYTELEGRARLMDGPPIHAPLSGALCVWYSYKIEERRDSTLDNRQKSHWRTIQAGTSDAIFHLQDDTGLCIVDPEGADVTPSHSITWRSHSRVPRVVPEASPSLLGSLFSTGAYRFTEKRIHPGDPLYAIGLFESIGSHDALHAHAEVRALLSDWKRDRALMLKRFDLDRNGEIDLAEWEHARREAEREVDKTMRERAKQPQLHLLKKPPIGDQPFILSTIPQRQMINRYAFCSALAALGFLVLGAGLTWSIGIRVDGKTAPYAVIPSR